MLNYQLITTLFCRVDRVLVGGVRLPRAGRADEGASQDPLGPLGRAERRSGAAQVRGPQGSQRRAARNHRQKVSLKYIVNGLCNVVTAIGKGM